MSKRALLLGAGGLAASAAGAYGGYWWLTRGVVAGEESKLLAASFEGLDGKTQTMSAWQQ